MSGILSLLSPSRWHGMTAIIMIAVLLVIGLFANGGHRFVRAAAFLLVALVAVVAVFNHIKQP